MLFFLLSFFIFFFFFFFNDTATTEIYTLSLHDALPISTSPRDERSHMRTPTCTVTIRCSVACAAKASAANLADAAQRIRSAPIVGPYAHEIAGEDCA